MISLHDGDASFASSFTKVVYSEDGKQCFSAGFKPTKGKKFVVLLLGEVDKTAIDYDLEAALNRLGFYRKEDNRL
ncbi:Uncharacterised protein [Enterobacter hormaechei]|nr:MULTISPECIES: hypothetical protein [Enterobacter cloacae complex]DAI71346.1 MAG TPA: hypothetical protein [Caudoviricetes sp.]MCW3887666.1 hypothetical protein [Enterobacter hormaechei subsp. hoffmannii]OWS95372.1 hypothetical protein CEQ52_13070 [Enterobacter kobei]QLV78712.1 hypothetical protein HV259_14325 [Enterobacter hormaechei]SAB25143.1 Uncharacterised protein [Enterobacter hormaechei]